MTTPLSVQEQLRQSYFIPQNIIALLFATTSFDQVWVKDADGNAMDQALPDNGQAVQDCSDMSDFLRKFGVTEKDTYYLENASVQQTVKMYKSIVQKLTFAKQQNPPEDILIIHNFSGRSTSKNGMQTYVFNEFDESSAFYKVLAAEDLLRQLASEFPNSYQIGIFTDSNQLPSMEACVRKPSNEEGQIK